MGSFEQIFSSICKYLLTKLNVNVTLHKDLSSLLEKNMLGTNPHPAQTGKIAGDSHSLTFAVKGSERLSHTLRSQS